MGNGDMKKGKSKRKQNQPHPHTECKGRRQVERELWKADVWEQMKHGVSRSKMQTKVALIFFWGGWIFGAEKQLWRTHVLQTLDLFVAAARVYFSTLPLSTIVSASLINKINLSRQEALLSLCSDKYVTNMQTPLPLRRFPYSYQIQRRFHGGWKAANASDILLYPVFFKSQVEARFLQVVVFQSLHIVA